MTPRLRNVILRSQRETRRAEGRQTKEDIDTGRQYEDMKELRHFCGFHLAIPTAHEIEPVLEWNGTAAVAKFSIDGHSFVVWKEVTEFILLAGSESGRELARVERNSNFAGGARLLSALGDFLSVSGTEVPEL